jgi:hypothetical protein
MCFVWLGHDHGLRRWLRSVRLGRDVSLLLLLLLLDNDLRACD